MGFVKKSMIFTAEVRSRRTLFLPEQRFTFKKSQLKGYTVSAAALTITSARFPMKIRQISVGAFRDTFPPANIFDISAIFCLESASSTANSKG